MSHNTFGHLFRMTTWGESHGPAIGCVVDGCPPGVALTEADIQVFLDKKHKVLLSHELLQLRAVSSAPAAHAETRPRSAPRTQAPQIDIAAAFASDSPPPASSTLGLAGACSSLPVLSFQATASLHA